MSKGLKNNHFFGTIELVKMEVMEMNFISGENRNQITLMPDSVEDYIDDNNSVRVIEAYINSLNLAELDFARSQPRETGRPMYDPKDLLKLYLYGYMNKVRSSRRLETETKRNLEVIWLLRKLSPDHKTIARFRRDNTVALKNVFRNFVKLCVEMNLYGKELIAIDGSKFKAVNSKDRNFTRKKLQDRIARIDAKIEEYLLELEDSDWQDAATDGEKSTEEIAEIIAELAERKDRYQSYADELAQTGDTQKSLTDPDSRLMISNGKKDICYNIQTAVDAKNKLIVEFDVTNNATDNNQITPMVEISKAALEAEKLTVVVDAGYDSVQDIVTCIKLGNDIHVASTDFDICMPSNEQSEITTHKDGRPVYYADSNTVLCPMGNSLHPEHYKKSGFGVFYNSAACKQCTHKCSTEKRGRRYQVPMRKADFSKNYNEKDLFVKQIRITPDKDIVRKRKSIVEHPFGTIKRNMDAGYCLTRGLKSVNGEFSLTFLAYNFKRAINILGAKKLIENIV